MSATLLVRDETLDGRSLGEWSLDVLTERLTVRELVRSRVYQEVQGHNLTKSDTFRGLVQPSPEEEQFNGPTAKRSFRPIDWKKQYETATEAFETGRILILVDDKQAESLDEEFDVRPGTAVTFLRLTLLVGG